MAIPQPDARASFGRGSWTDGSLAGDLVAVALIGAVTVLVQRGLLVAEPSAGPGLFYILPATLLVAIRFGPRGALAGTLFGLVLEFNLRAEPLSDQQVPVAAWLASLASYSLSAGLAIWLALSRSSLGAGLYIAHATHSALTRRNREAPAAQKTEEHRIQASSPLTRPPRTNTGEWALPVRRPQGARDADRGMFEDAFRSEGGI